ncbi:MAG: hypothetical protein WKF75_01145, partial [Singulisphaera sp.]
SPTPRLQIYNWQVGVRETASTTGRGTVVEDLVESQAFVYMSPEAMADDRKVTEASDVFSLGAIAFHLFASRPPATDPTDLARILREQKGLSISSVLDGAGPKLEELIRWSTHPDVLTRIGSVEDFLTLLDDVEDELTAPAEAVVVDPLQAKRGDRLEHGFVVERVLGQGATATALLVKKDEKEYVLKVAHPRSRTPGCTRRPRPCGRSTASSSSPSRTSWSSAAGPCSSSRRRDRRWRPCCDRRACRGWKCSPATATTSCRPCPRWSGTGWPTGTSPDNVGLRSLTKGRNQLILFDFSRPTPRWTTSGSGRPATPTAPRPPQAPAVGPACGAVLNGGDPLRDEPGPASPSGGTASPTRR